MGGRRPVIKTSAIVSKYIFKEMIPPFLINLLFFTFVFLLTRILDITNMIVNYQIGIFTVARLFLYSMPFFLIFVIPMSVMVSVLLTFLRLSGDNEIIALKSGGVSLYQLVPAAGIFCFAACLLTGFMTIFAAPYGEFHLKKLAIDIASSHIDIGLKERTFNDSFKDVMLYVSEIDPKDKTLKDVFIQDQRSKNLVISVVSPEGRLFREPDRAVFHLKLANGLIHQVSLENRTVNTVHFGTYEIALDLEQMLSQAEGFSKNEKQMSLGELRQYLENAPQKDAQYYLTLLEFHKKFSIPFACFALGLLALPLGAQSKSAKQSAGFGLAMGFFLLYYLMLSAGTVFGETGDYPPVIAVWVPNIITGGIGWYLLVRTVNDRPLQLDFFWGIIGRIKSFFASAF